MQRSWNVGGVNSLGTRGWQRVALNRNLVFGKMVLLLCQGTSAAGNSSAEPRLLELLGGILELDTEGLQ